jgi:hypothetical protein
MDSGQPKNSPVNSKNKDIHGERPSIVAEKKREAEWQNTREPQGK